MLACSCLHHAMKRSGAATFAPGFCLLFPRQRASKLEVAGRLKADVRLWHKADMLNALTNVRFLGQSGHDANGPLCRLMTHNGPSSAAITR